MNRLRSATLLSLCSGIMCWGSAEVASGQRFGTVQLPTYQQFSMTTSLWVPDQGGVYAGGVHGSRHLRRRGPRAGGVGAGNVTVTAYVHDFEALDAAVIEQGRQLRLRKGPALPRHKKALTRHTVTRAETISEVRARTQSKRATEHARARADYELAQRLLKKGKVAAARILLKSALSRADNALRSNIEVQMASLGTKPTTDRLANKSKSSSTTMRPR